MPPRYDISGIPLQGGYVAKQCPVRAQNDTLQPAEPIPPDPFRRRLYESGNAFEAEVFAEVIALHAGAVVITEHGRDAEEATLAAMQRATPLILGGRLPSDQVGRRVGRPDILVAAAGGGYRAVDVKWHLNLEPASAKDFELPGRSSSLAVRPNASGVQCPRVCWPTSGTPRSKAVKEAPDSGPPGGRRLPVPSRDRGHSKPLLTMCFARQRSSAVSNGHLLRECKRPASSARLPPCRRSAHSGNESRARLCPIAVRL